MGGSSGATDKSAGTAGIVGVCPAQKEQGLSGFNSQLCLSPDGASEP